MAFTVEITDGTTTFDLIYDATTQPYYHSRKGLSVTTEDTDVLQHIPDDGEPTPIRANDRDRTVFLTKDVLGTSQDEVLNKIAELKRFIDGKDQLALRYWTVGDVDRVDLKIQLENATNYTLNPIKWGHVDDSGAHYTAAAQKAKYAIGILVTLHLTPYGEGAAISLQNDLASSPHMLEDSNSDGLADGLVAVGTPTTTINTNNYLAGGKSQKVITDASTTEGFRTDSVTASTSSTAVAYVWIMVTVGGDAITILLTDGSNNSIDSVSWDPDTPTTGSDKTAVGAGGNTWYRVVVSGTNSTAANFRIFVQRASGVASEAMTFFVDNMYLQVGTTTAPDAWCSTSAIENRYDPDSSNESEINHVDIWGVPGDTDAIIDTTLECTAITGTKDVVLASRWTDGAVAAADVLHWVDNADMTLQILSGSQSSPADASRSAGTYLRHTADAGSVDNATLRIDIGSTIADVINFLSIPHRMFLITRSSSTATTYTLNSDFNFVDGFGEVVSPNAANTWELLDLGYLVSLDPVIGNYTQIPGTSTLDLTIVPGATSATVDIDAILLMGAVSDGWCIVSGTSTAADSTYITQFIGSEKTAFGGRDTSFPGVHGSVWNIPPGNRMSRLVFCYTNSTTNVHHLSDTMTASFVIYPRTRHLLGTL